ncbi:MAG: cytochrome d ubiquinol oxidase subunit II [Candidatus Hodarchaeota archaeon]
MSLLQELWFFLLVFIIIIYSILDGFDLGVGFWYFLTKDKRERKTIIKTIAPFWDGNEVWLLAAGGVLFAAFPEVYATVFSTFYLPLVIVAFGLILRAVTIELKDEFDSPLWEMLTDIGFILGSMIPAISFGILIGNLIQGIPLDETSNFSGTLITLINPYSLFIGVMSLIMMISHGAIYLRVRTANRLAEKATRWAKVGLIGYFSIAIIVLVVSAFMHPHLRINFIDAPLLIVIPIVGFLTILLSIWLIIKEKNPVFSFITSAISIGLNILGVGLAIFPNLVYASNNSSRNLTVYNASSGELTLSTILGVALIALPLVLAYTAWTYKTFSGKIELAELEEIIY